MRNILWGNIHETFRNNQKISPFFITNCCSGDRVQSFFCTSTLISTVIGPIKKFKFSCRSLNSIFVIFTQ